MICTCPKQFVLKVQGKSEKKIEIRPVLKALQNSSQLSTYSANKLGTKVKLKFFARKWNEELCSYMEIRNFFFLEF
jgi:hypothetical protein